MVNKILLIVMAMAISIFSQEQNAVSGFIYERSNGESLIGATVYIQGTKAGAVTNNSGYFIINNVPTGKQTVVVTFIGYQSIKVPITVPSEESIALKIFLDAETVSTTEVVVSADKADLGERLFVSPISKIELTGKEINTVPKMVEADLLRALQTMPGITSLSDFSSALYVRGGTPDQNLFLVDGADIYNPDHAFGIFSTFNTNAIKKVEVSKGGFGSEYGGRLSSVIDVTNLDGNRNNIEGVANISLLSGTTTIQVPIGSIGSISGSIRRTYIDQTYSKWSKDIPDYYFYDANLKAFFDLGNNDKVSASYFSSKDNLDYRVDKDSPTSLNFNYNWGNTTGSLTWKHVFNQNLFSTFKVTGTGYSSNFKIANIFQRDEINTLEDYAVKGMLEYYPFSYLLVKFGAEAKIMSFQYKQSSDDAIIDISQKSVLSTAYADFEIKPWDNLAINAGVRINNYSCNSAYTDIEPRFSIKYRLSNNDVIKFASGSYHQYVNRIPRVMFSSIWASVDNDYKPSGSIHAILGYERKLAEDVSFEFEVYYKDYTNLLTFNQNVSTSIEASRYTSEGLPIYSSTKGIFNRGDGNSKGFELLLRKETGAITGWVSYTYSHTETKEDGINQNAYFSPRHDRTSTVNVVFNADLTSIFGSGIDRAGEFSSKWLLGLNFVYSTGQPLTVPGSAYLISNVPDLNPSQSNIPGYKLYPTEINSFRLPAYSRVDLSITYEKNYGTWSLAPYLQIINLLNRQNVWFINYKNEIQNNALIQKADIQTMLPLLPSVGVTIKF